MDDGEKSNDIFARPTDNIAAARRYAEERIRVGLDAGPLAQYGSADWLALPDNDVRKAAAVWLAALAWLDYWTPERCAERVADRLAVAEQLEAAEFAALAEDVRRHGDLPTIDELARRRAVKPRPNDYPGLAGGAAGVEWATGKWVRTRRGAS